MDSVLWYGRASVDPGWLNQSGPAPEPAPARIRCQCCIVGQWARNLSFSSIFSKYVSHLGWTSMWPEPSRIPRAFPIPAETTGGLMDSRRRAGQLLEGFHAQPANVNHFPQGGYGGRWGHAKDTPHWPGAKRGEGQGGGWLVTWTKWRELRLYCQTD